LLSKRTVQRILARLGTLEMIGRRWGRYKGGFAGVGSMGIIRLAHWRVGKYITDCDKEAIIGEDIRVLQLVRE
jgi:hypothetical protein